MPDLRIQRINESERPPLAALMDEEERRWQAELDWDYSPIRRILDTLVARRALPGLVAMEGRRAAGYTYFLIHNRRAVIGSAYARPPGAQAVVEALLAPALEDLQGSAGIRRIEAQVMPLNGVDLDCIFLRHGFRSYLREYLELDLAAFGPSAHTGGAAEIVPWDSGYLRQAAAVARRSYQNEADALISEDYGSDEGCEGYLRSLVEHPGCGVFLPEASFIALDSAGAPCGFIISSRISAGAGMIPQISVAPSHQGLGLGSRLMARALQRMKEEGLRCARLTVTRDNRRAHAWYLRLGFASRLTFGAYVWLRPSPPGRTGSK